MKKFLIASLALFSLVRPTPSLADKVNGKTIYLQRCAMCHGTDLKGTGALARKSTPPTPDLTTPAFKKRLNDYPGVIVSSVVPRPNGDLIPRNWRNKDLRDLHQYMSGEISRSR
ncbi:c-type cytochrome [Comamonas testosteroni]